MIIFSIIESPLHPNLSSFYATQGIEEIRLTSVRKAIQSLKKHKPDYVLADFIYGYGNNYAGVNISNLDVFLYSLEKYAPQCKVMVCYEKGDKDYVQKLKDLFPSIETLAYPVTDEQMLSLIK